ncbi:MAG: hypothetical protein AB7E70_00960 [Hyphomicrobiaceae bacterium]
MYRRLDPDKILASLAVLEKRIDERFPGAGLARVCAELADIARQSRARIERIGRPNLMLRALTGLIIGGGALLLVYVGTIVEVKRGAENLFGVLQGIEASMNILVLMGAALLFLFTLETRVKRREALQDLHELLSIVHVIDMHQLTKDPSATVTISQPTPSSPQRRLTPFELSRYLDYCSEMLSLTAKVAAVYAQSSRDSVVLDAAYDIGQITTNLTAKIWQKIMIIHSMTPEPVVGSHTRARMDAETTAARPATAADSPPTPPTAGPSAPPPRG